MSGLEVYKIGKEAIITLQPSTGYISVSCPWHDELNGCHWWNSRGDLSLHQFLIGLNREYAMGKLFAHRSLEEYDEEKTIEILREHVLSDRRNGGISKSQAREIMNEIASCECEDDVARIEGFDCAYEYIKSKPKQCALWFWDHVWESFIDHLKGNKENA